MFDRVHDDASIALSAINGQAKIAFAAYPAGLHLSQTNAMGDFTHIGKAISYLRERAGVSQKELSLATGIDPGNLNRILNGKQWPTPERLQALSGYFKVSVSEMFRIAEQGPAPAAPVKEDPRKAALKALIDQLGDDQLDAAFRHSPDGDCERQPAATPALDPATPALPASLRRTG